MSLQIQRKMTSYRLNSAQCGAALGHHRKKSTSNDMIHPSPMFQAEWKGKIVDSTTKGKEEEKNPPSCQGVTAKPALRLCQTGCM